MATPPAPAFDPNAALRQFNEYFGNLRKTQGEAAIRAAGFTPRDLSALQATLRKLQMDPNATPEQHQQAYQQARDTLAQRLTTPATVAATPPPQEIVVTGTPRPPMPEPVSAPPPSPFPAQPPMPRDMGTPPTPPVNFDRNAALQQFNKNFGDMRQKYGNEFFTSQGFTPRDLAALQGNLRSLQLDPNSTQSQHDAALKSAMDTLNQRLMFPVEPSPMPPAAQPGNPVSDFIANMNAPKPPATGMLNPVGPAPTPPMALPGGTGYDERGNMLPGATQPSIGDILAKGIGAGPASGAPVASSPSAGGMMGLLGGMPSTPPDIVVSGTRRPDPVPSMPEMPIIPTPMPQPGAPPLPGMYRGGFAVKR